MYDNSYFDYISIGSMRSAAMVAPVVLKNFAASTLIDVGCGRGAWLVEWDRAGMPQSIGVDGDYVDQERFLVPRDRFISRDLTKPFDLGRKFDLAVSLEVAEHIRPEATECFVDNICRHADAVLLSAAPPGQGGTFHVNEQSYGFWRDRFAARGYRLFDFVRHAIRDKREVEPWYRFNSMFFARGEAIGRLSPKAIATEIGAGDEIPDFSSTLWRLRKEVVKRLPMSVTDRLIELKHRFVRLTHA